MVPPFGWTVTIMGAVLCLLYGWFLGRLKDSIGGYIEKVGFVIAAVGALTLTAMAFVGPSHHNITIGRNSMRTIEGFPKSRSDTRCVKMCAFPLSLGYLARTLRQSYWPSIEQTDGALGFNWALEKHYRTRRWQPCRTRIGNH